MKQYTKIIGYITALLFVITVVIGYFIFHELNVSLLQHQKERFYAESESKIKILKERIVNATENFKSYAQLPSFKSIRFHSLTLNHLAVKESQRQLELFFFDSLKNNEHLMAVQFIDNEGNEIIKVDRFSIHSIFGNVLHNESASHIIELDLGHNEFQLDTISDNSGKLKSLVWWLPVYVSSSTRLGYLVFNVDAALIDKQIIEIAETGINYVVITNESDKPFQGDYQLISEPLPSDLQHQSDKWLVSDTLPLTGLNWKISIIGNREKHTEGITTMQSAVNFGLIPSSFFIFIFMVYVYRKKIEADKHIHHLAYYDSLTGLVNRHQFDNALNIALIETQEHNSHNALLYLDLDQFKIVNDTCGHLAGDKLLEELSTHLKQSVRDSDMLARLGGDEFALLLNLCPEDMAIAIAEKMLAAVSDFRFIWQDKPFSIGVSIGVVFINSPHDTASNVLRKADLACYMAKELGRNRIHVYTDEDQTLEERHGEMKWVERIKRALADDLFFLVAQRILPLGDNINATQHYEILIRLNENNKSIMPGAFIPAAERYGIMPNIDKWVINKTFSIMEKLIQSHDQQNMNNIFSINVSGSSIGDKSFFRFIKEKMTHYKIPAEFVCFEITETAAITNLSIAMDFIHNIKALGCSLSLDDFGSGLCSFSYLKTIPVDYLKIDGSFVTRMLDNPLDMAIVTAIKQISLATNSKVIAEFVTSTDIKEKLNELGIDYVQGYGIARPVPINELFNLS